jgi:hypothetical protein
MPGGNDGNSSIAAKQMTLELIQLGRSTDEVPPPELDNGVRLHSRIRGAINKERPELFQCH